MGCFDTLKVRCPSCKRTNEFQSKADSCKLATYNLHNAPLSIIADLESQSKLDQISCKFCNIPIEIKVQRMVSVEIKEPVSVDDES